MKGLVQRRARVARVRRVQHLQAAGAAAQAEGRANALENTAEHLAQLRLSLTPALGAMSASQLSSAAELGTRLDAVRHGLTDSIVAARAAALETAARRLEARIRQESAERLEERAATASALAGERRRQASGGRRRGEGTR